MTKQQILDQIKSDIGRIERITNYNILYPKMSIKELTDRIKQYGSALEELDNEKEVTDLNGRWMQIYLFDNEPLYAKFKCSSNTHLGHALFYGLFDYNSPDQKIYTPIPLDRCMLVDDTVGRSLEFANGLNGTKNSLIELGAIVNGQG